MNNKSNKVKRVDVAYVVINKYTGVSDEYNRPCTDTEIHS